MIQDAEGIGEKIFPVGTNIELVLRYDEDYHRGTVGFEELVMTAEVLSGALATVHAKNRLYAGAWREQGWRGNVARILSKSARIKNMLWTTHTLESGDEPVQDTLLDLINLSAFTLLNRRAMNEWGRGTN